MKTLHRSNIPSFYKYYRSSTELFYEYYKSYSSCKVFKIPLTQDFFHAKKIFPGFWSIDAIKIDTLPSLGSLKALGISHGIIFWAPLRTSEKPSLWYRLPRFYAKSHLHSSRSAFCVLDTPEYWKKWSPQARNHRKHVLQEIQSGIITIESSQDITRFIELYAHIEHKNPYRKIVSRMSKKLFENTTQSYRIYFITVDWEVTAWAIFLDDGDISEYWAACYDRGSSNHHLWVAMMDIWMQESYTLGIKICDLDHMRDSGQSKSFKGYTKFKENFADYDVYFHDMWGKVF